MISLAKFCNANKKRKFINILIYALLIIEILAFVSLPFIRSEKIVWKIIFLVIWGLACLELVLELVYYLVDITYLQKRDKPIKEKGEHVLFWITFSAYIIALISIFLGAFLIQNFGAKISLGKYVFIVATILIVLGIASLIVSHRKNLLEFFKIISVIALSIIAVVFLLSGIIAKETNEIGSKVLICIGAGALVFILSSIFIKGFLKLSESKNLVKDVGLIVLVFVLLAILSSIFIICVVPQDNQGVFVTIISAVLGGVVTFLGVAWTIKKQDKDRKEEEKKKAKPIFTFVKSEFNIGENHPEIECHILVKKENYDDVRHTFCAKLINSNLAGFILKRIYHQGKWYSVEGNNTVLPNGYTTFMFSDKKIDNLYFEIEDFLGNKYYYEVDTKFFHFITKESVLYTISKIEEIPFETIQNN